MKKSSPSLMLLLFVFFSQFLFAEIEFISPVPGVWGNKQMLIIDNEKEGDYFYSVNGSDPEKFGFAYDGPVLLDIDGDVELKVTYQDIDGHKDYGTVKYTVESNNGRDVTQTDFINNFFDTGFYDYLGDEPLSIPSNLSYSFEKTAENFIQGTDLSISEKSILTRIFPCTLYDENTDTRWRFIIRINQQSYGILSKREVPFTITDWETITFNNDQLLYKIDSEYWGLPEEPVIIDRSVSHMISWQSLDYKLGNIVEYVVLPPKPDIFSVENEDGSLSFCIDGDSSYMLGVLNNDNNSPELFSEVCLDVFYGDKISDNITLGIYSDSIYQGKTDFSYNIDKRPPVIPVINSSTNTFYSRNPVEININKEEDAQLFVAVSEPYIIEDTKKVYAEDDIEFKSVNTDDFNICSDNIFKITLEPVDQKVVYYKIAAYNEKGNKKSNTSYYSVILDQSSYYFNADAKNSTAEGTMLNPFTTIEQCLEVIKNTRSVSLKVTGDLYIDKHYDIFNNIKIINNGQGRLLFGPKGSLDITDSSLEIDNFRIHKIKDSSDSLIIPFFKLNRGTLDLNNCQISADFNGNGTIIDSLKSIITIKDSIVSINAHSYASFISSIDSRLSIAQSSISTSGDTSVIISASKGNVDVVNSNFKVIGKIGRIAELFDVKARFENNEFKGMLDKSSKAVTPIFIDKKSSLIEKDNIQIGF